MRYFKRFTFITTAVLVTIGFVTSLLLDQSDSPFLVQLLFYPLVVVMIGGLMVVTVDYSLRCFYENAENMIIGLSFRHQAYLASLTVILTIILAVVTVFIFGLILPYTKMEQKTTIATSLVSGLGVTIFMPALIVRIYASLRSQSPQNGGAS